MITPITELDFDNIKKSLKAFLTNTDSSNPNPFSDYNFEGSALNSILNILAYNTHNIAYYANMLHSEGFLDTAQKRSSVVSRAKELGYTPHSVSGSKALVDIIVTGVSNTPLNLDRGTIFSSSNDNGSYSFIVDENYTSVTAGPSQTFSNVRLVEGVQLSNYFTVDYTNNPNGIFTIPNQNIDITTLKVYVREVTSTDVEYTRAISVLDLLPTSKIYFIQESYDGYYQIYFGGGILGVQPAATNIVTVNYIMTDNQALANGCSTFIVNQNYGNGSTTMVTTKTVSYAGSGKETKESIKNNTKLAFTARERAVTTSDYISIVKANIDTVRSVCVWSGEENSPPEYGKVFISLQPKSGQTISDSEKNNVILPLIRRYSVIGTIPVLYDPTYTDIEFTTNIRYNKNDTPDIALLVSGVKTIITTYVDSVSEFNKDYFNSELELLIPQTYPSVVSVNVSTRVGFTLMPLLNTYVSHKKYLNNPISIGSVSSTKFIIFYGSLETVSMQEDLSSLSRTVDAFGNSRSTATIGLYNSLGNKIIDIGTVEYETGKFDLLFNVYSYISSFNFIYIRCMTVYPDIFIKRNQIISMRPDVANEIVNISSNNVVNAISYSK